MTIKSAPKILTTILCATLLASCGGGNSSPAGGGGSGGGRGGGGIPTPSISLVAPASVTTGIQIIGLTLYGQGFFGGSQVLIDGQPATTTYVDSGTLNVGFSTSLSATTGVHQLSVVNDSYTSNSLPYTVYTPPQGPMVLQAFPSFLVSDFESDPTFSATGDLNGDGLADLVIQGPGTGNGTSLAVLFGQPDGTLSSPQYLPIPEAPFNLLIGDVDGNGTADLVLIISDNSSTTSVSVMFGDGHGNFQQPTLLQTFPGAFPFSAYIGDLDGDGKPDLLMNAESTLGSSGTLVWLKNTGGGFAAPVAIGAYPADYGYFSVADFNVDGKPDIIHIAGDSTFHIIWNQGNGKFSDQAVPSLSGFSGAPTVFDFNLDGIPDLALQTTQNLQTTLYVLAGDGKGGFSQVSSTSLSSSSTTLLTGDFDHDGFPDLVGMASSGTSAISFFFGDGHGNFTNQQFNGPFGVQVTTADFNGDGLPDLLFADRDAFVTLILGRKDRNFPSPLGLLAATVSSLLTGNINGDGMPDIFVGGNYYYNLPGTVFLNQGNGNFQLAAYTDPTSFALADFTGKGVSDLVGGATGVEIWPNNLTPNFSSSPISVAPSTSNVTIADMDGDGRDDFISACEAGGCPGQIFYGNGSYQFTPVTVPNLSWPYFVGDFNGDGKLDLADTSMTYLNTGGRNFIAVQKNNNVGFSHGSMMFVADFNGDGKDDVAINLPGERFITIYYSRGDGTFYQATDIDVGDYPGAFAVGDFDGDGRVDFAVGLIFAQQACIYFNAGNTQFRVSCLASGVSTQAIAAADLKGTGKLDLMIGNTMPASNVNVVFHK